MKATKKIVGAACALVAAVALSAGSTFAWFAQSGTVSATGMNVKATTSKNLVISNSSTGTFGSTAAAVNATVMEMTPASTADGKSFFYVTNPEEVDYATGAAGNGATFAAATATPVTSSLSAPTTASPYYVMEYSYWVKADAASGVSYNTLYVSKIDVKQKADGTAAAAQNISKALRVSVEYGSNTFIYAPVTGATTTYKGINAVGTKGSDTVESTADVVIKTAGTTADNLGSVTTTAAQVTIRVWYEGQDTNCTSANSINVEELTVAVSLTAADVSGS